MIEVAVVKDNVRSISPLLDPKIITKEWDDWLSESFPMAFYKKEKLSWILKDEPVRAMKVVYCFEDSTVALAFKLRWTGY